jgi:hypothetical protein
MNFGELLGLGFGENITDGTTATSAQVIVSVIRNGLVIFFAIIVIAAIIYAAYSGLKFIRSQGASDKVEEATEAIKYTLIGLGVAFIGVIAVIIVSGIFADGTMTNLSLRCALGDFQLCEVRAVDSNNNCPKDYSRCSNTNVCAPKATSNETCNLVKQ